MADVGDLPRRRCRAGLARRECSDASVAVAEQQPQAPIPLFVRPERLLRRAVELEDWTEARAVIERASALHLSRSAQAEIRAIEADLFDRKV